MSTTYHAGTSCLHSVNCLTSVEATRRIKSVLIAYPYIRRQLGWPDAHTVSVNALALRLLSAYITQQLSERQLRTLDVIMLLTIS